MLSEVSFYCTYFFVIYIYSRIKVPSEEMENVTRNDFPQALTTRAMADGASQATVVQAVERLTHNVLRSLVEAVKCEEAKPSPAAVLLVEPRHSLIHAPRHGIFKRSRRIGHKTYHDIYIE